MTGRTKFILVFVLGMIFGIVIISQFAFRDNSGHERKLKEKDGSPVEATYRTPDLPKQMNFAGEKVPIEEPEIQELFDRELLYNYYSPGNVLYILKLSKRFFPIIEPILQQQGVPDDFKYLCVAESNLTPARSYAGAQGYWQFMAGTAPGYNLEVSKYVDERNNIGKSTEAACKYLKRAYEKFGNWTAAAASYNCGMGGYNSQATYQKTKYYYDLQLPAETNRYIYRILTFKYLFSNAQNLGFKLEQNDLYKNNNLKKYMVSSNISNLSDWAKDKGSNYRMLRWYNPWLISRSLVVKPGKQYEIYLPE